MSSHDRLYTTKLSCLLLGPEKDAMSAEPGVPVDLENTMPEIVPPVMLSSCVLS